MGKFLVIGKETNCFAGSVDEAVSVAFKMLCVESKIYATTVRELWEKAKEKFDFLNAEDEEDESSFSAYQGSCGDYETLRLTLGKEVCLSYEHTWDEYAGAGHNEVVYKVSIIDLDNDITSLCKVNSRYNKMARKETRKLESTRYEVIWKEKQYDEEGFVTTEDVMGSGLTKKEASKLVNKFNKQKKQQISEMCNLWEWDSSDGHIEINVFYRREE